VPLALRRDAQVALDRQEGAPVGRPSLGHDARNVPVTVKVTTREALALKDLGGSPAKGLRRLIDQGLGGRTRHEPAGVPPDGVPVGVPRSLSTCRIHKRWTDPIEFLQNGHKTISKTCLDCGYVSTTTRPA
jgi:hypothetical protein